MTYQLVQVCPTRPIPNRGEVVAHGTKEEIEGLWDALGDPWHFKVVWQMPFVETKRWPEASKGSFRRKQLKRRLERKHPLLADVLYQEQVLADRDYYEGKTQRRKQQ